jgi:peptide methionine sulfoxide reductase MsrA
MTVKRARLCGPCFAGVAEAFRARPGVVAVCADRPQRVAEAAGLAVGRSEDATIEVSFDTARTSLAELVQWFTQSHGPGVEPPQAGDPRSLPLQPRRARPITEAAR